MSKEENKEKDNTETENNEEKEENNEIIFKQEEEGEILLPPQIKWTKGLGTVVKMDKQGRRETWTGKPPCPDKENCRRFEPDHYLQFSHSKERDEMFKRLLIISEQEEEAKRLKKQKKQNNSNL